MYKNKHTALTNTQAHYGMRLEFSAVVNRGGQAVCLPCILDQEVFSLFMANNSGQVYETLALLSLPLMCCQANIFCGCVYVFVLAYLFAGENSKYLVSTCDSCRSRLETSKIQKLNKIFAQKPSKHCQLRYGHASPLGGIQGHASRRKNGTINLFEGYIL